MCLQMESRNINTIQVPRNKCKLKINIWKNMFIKCLLRKKQKLIWKFIILNFTNYWSKKVWVKLSIN